jgi:hypothetical protein
MRTRVRGSPVSERAADEDCFPALLPRRRRGLALKEVIKSPEVDVGGLILSHESWAPSICPALCTARKIANIGILGRERTAVAEILLPAQKKQPHRPSFVTPGLSQFLRMVRNNPRLCHLSLPALKGGSCAQS